MLPHASISTAYPGAKCQQERFGARGRAQQPRQHVDTERPARVGEGGPSQLIKPRQLLALDDELGEEGVVID
eukprot:6978264-Pyramimonas_sp.AAC.1